ncbi:LacI family DNA-binding transcriptional regulator [Fervidobacterium sp.]
MANIRDVARMANVSIATVSRVINGSENVSDETRKKVLNAMKKLNYKPMMSFKTNERQLFKTIGILFPDIRGYHYSDIVMAIEEYAYSKGFDIMLALPKGEPDLEKHVLDQYFRRKVDGVIIGELYGGQKLIDRFVKSAIPMVVVDFAVEEINFDIVSVDNVGGGYAAIKHLYNNGHKKILFIPGPDNSPAALDRERGMRRFLDKVTGKDKVEIYYGTHRGYNSEHGWVSVTRHIQEHGLNFTAIFAVNDWAAIGAIDALKDQGLKVPDDVSVIGFDDAPFANYTNPRLTTVMQPRWEMGTTAAQLLIERILEKKTRLPRNIILPTKIVERESVKDIKPSE